MEGIEDVCQRFYYHHNFLMKSMLEGQEGLDWTDTPIFHHLKDKFPVSKLKVCSGG